MADVQDLLLVSVGGGEPQIAGVAHRHLGQHQGRSHAVAGVQRGRRLRDGIAAGVVRPDGHRVDGLRHAGRRLRHRRHRHGPAGRNRRARPDGDAAALREAPQDLLNHDNGTMVSDNCRRIAVDEYSLAVQARGYRALYQSMVAQSKRAGRPADNKV